MLNKVLANQAEQIAVTPDQAAFVLKNKSDFKNQLDVDVSMYNTNIANSFINNKLQNNPDWNKYLQDPFRRNNPDYKRYFALSISKLIKTNCHRRGQRWRSSY